MSYWSNGQVTLYHGDVVACLRGLPAESVHCVVTSPPYWGLRDYGTAAWEGGEPDCAHEGSGRYYTEKTAASSSVEAFSLPGEANAARIKAGRWRESGECIKCGAVHSDQQIGLEETPAAYVERMVEVFREVRRALRPDGTLWLNLGDSYGTGAGRNDTDERNLARRSAAYGTGTGAGTGPRDFIARTNPIKPKDLIGIPWRVAFALQADGWWLRSEITWCKRAPMPESVTDRPTSATEKVFLLAKSERYSYDADAVREPPAGYDRKGGIAPWTAESGHTNGIGSGTFHQMSETGRNARNYWLLGPEPFAEAHFATFVSEIPRRAILAGTSERGCCAECGAPWLRVVERERPAAYEGRGVRYGNDGNGMRMPDKWNTASTTTGWRPTCAHEAPAVPCVVLDPFVGSGTTCMVATSLGRRSIGIDLNAEYLDVAVSRNLQLALELAP